MCARCSVVAMNRSPVIVTVVMLACTWCALQVRSHGEPVLAKKPFVEFPLTIAERWQGKEFGLEQNTLDVLKLSDYMMRAYVPVSRAQTMGDGREGERGGATSPVWLYVGYY